jgi:hypothetical protein
VKPALRETDVKRAILQHLRLRGFRAWVRNVGGAYGLQFVRFGEPGQADIWGYEPGTARHLEVEVKRPGARTHPKRAALQHAWLEQCQRDGVIAFQAASVEEAEQRLAELGYPKRLLI